MRIPHIINGNTLTVYIPSPQSLDLVGEDIRQIISENFTYGDDECPPLTDFCVQAICKNFEKKTLLNELPCADRDYLLEILSVDLPLELVIPLINDEFYWKRRYDTHFGLVTQIKPRVWTWKSLYLERHVQKLVEEAQPQYNDEESYDDLLKLCCPYIKRLFATQLQYWQPPLTMDEDEIPEVYPIEHITFGPIFSKLTLIEEIDLVYGMNKVGEKFEWEMFAISVYDCTKLGKAVLDLKELHTLRVHKTKMEYPQCQALMQGLIKNTTITELDLSNCRLGDKGALCVAKVLEEHPVLKILNLTNNNISKIGAEGLGFALCKNTALVLEVLNLRLNPLRNDGAMGIMRAIVRVPLPKELSFSACMFEDDTPRKICHLIKLNDTLTKLDISCNWFGEEDGEELVNAVRQNTTLQWLDVRDTDISPSQAAHINKYLERNRNEADESDEESSEDEESELKPAETRGSKADSLPRVTFSQAELGEPADTEEKEEQIATIDMSKED